MNELTEYDALSVPMRQVVDALAEGVPPPPGALERLSPQEVREVQLLSRTARLTVATLNAPPVDAGAEARALQQAQQALAQRTPPSGADSHPTRGGLLALLSRLRTRRQEAPPDAEKDKS